MRNNFLWASFACAGAQDLFLAASSNSSATCSDNGPDSNSCSDQKKWGKCREDWMVGYCCQSCHNCQGSGCGSGPSPSPAPSPTPPFPSGTALPGGIQSSSAYRCGIEGQDNTRKEMEEKIRKSCSGCSGGELATVLAIAMIESDKMDTSDTSKGTTGGASNWCPYNLNMDYLAQVGCGKSCAQSLGQHKSSFDMGACTQYLLSGLRGDARIGDTCDFMHFHRYGTTGWNAGKGKGCNYEDSSKCEGCSDYPRAIADGAEQILANHDYAFNGNRVCESVRHVR